MIHLRRTLAALLALFVLIISIPALAEVAPYDMSAPESLVPEHLYAQSALLIDEDTGEVLFTKNARVRMFPASTTKIMTLLLGIESGISLDEQVTIPAEAGDVPEGSSVIPVQPGDVMSYRDLLYSFMISSGNDGANAVAVLVDGGIDAFVQHMNARAAELGLEGTHYVNAHGYHDAEHYTTAQDLATLSRFAMTNPVFRDIVKQPTWTITVTRGGETKSAEILSRNTLLQKDQKYYYPDCTGIKTGHHGKAGWCFVGSAERDGMRVICVVLNCAGEMDKWYDAAKLFEYGFTRYEDVAASALLERAAESFDTVSVENAQEGDGALRLNLSEITGGEQTVKVVSGSDAALKEKTFALAETAQIEWTRKLAAPIAEGEALGAVRCTLPDGREVSAQLVASRNVAARPTAAPVITEAPAPPVEAPQTAAPQTQPEPSPKRGVPAFAVVLALLVLLIVSVGAAWYVTEQKRRRRRRRNKKRRSAVKTQK